MLDGAAQYLVWVIEILLPGFLLGVLLGPMVINDRKPAVTTIAWLFALVALPYLGAFLYYAFGYRRFRRRVRRKKQARYALASGLVELKDAIRAERITAVTQLGGALTRGLVRSADAMGSYPATTGNAVEILVDGAAKYTALIKAITAAQHHVHLEYYIFESDETGVRIRDLLIQKASQGIEIRVLVDAIGIIDQARGFFKPLKEAGGAVYTFLPVFRLTGRRRLAINFRNHRKIVVVDGQVGFLGGMNIGNEYSGYGKSADLPWHDIHMRLEGPAVHFLQETFAEDWFFTTNEDIASPRYFPAQSADGGEMVQIVPSGPDLEWPILHELFFTTISMARERVYIINPYFVPTESLLSALISAAHRGVDVRVILPHQGDQRLVFYAARSYYEELLKAGVRIYENKKRMVHAKVMAVDGQFVTVGSCNLDVRSFFLHFEINALIYSKVVAAQLDKIFHNDLKEVHPITLEAFLKRPLHSRLLENICRLLSPML